MQALQLVVCASASNVAGDNLLDSFYFTSPRLSGGGLGSTFSSSQRPSIVLLAPILMAWNRDESSPSYAGYTAAAAGAAAGAGDEATFRALLARQLQGAGRRRASDVAEKPPRRALAAARVAAERRRARDRPPRDLSGARVGDSSEGAC
jgi:hypothetical protein